MPSEEAVDQVVLRLWGVSLDVPRTSRFAQQGWYHAAAIDAPCPQCEGELHTLRKPYVSAGKNMLYTVVVCPACPAWFEMKALGVRSHAALLKLKPAPPASRSSSRAAHGVAGRAAMEAILQSWRAMEYFATQRLEPVSPRDHRYAVEASRPLPWQPEHSARLSTPENSRYAWRFTVFGGVFSLDRMHRRLGDVFGEDAIDVDERTPRGDSALFTRSVNEDGDLDLDSFGLSTGAWATGRCVSPGPASSAWLDGFDEDERRIRARVEELVVAATLGDGGDSGEPAPGPAVRYQLTPRLLDDLVSLVAAELAVSQALGPAGSRVTCSIVRRGSADQRPEFLNSFYVRDLDRAAAEIASAPPTSALADYLAEQPGRSRVDVLDERSRAFITDQLAPANIPPARWPERLDRRLATSQQLAINALIRDHDGERPIYGVNGPPGTGKTTMLRDLVAAIVTARAARLASLHHPDEAFDELSTGWRTENRDVRFRPLIPELTGFEMVVASSNNGAVENVTRELPSADQVDAPWRTADPLHGHASRVLGADAWGLLAAVLGRKAHRTAFVSRLWYDQGTPRPGAAAELAPDARGLESWLREARASAGPDDWRTAVESFRDAQSREAAIRAARQGAHEALAAIPDLHTAVHTATTALDDAEASLPGLLALADRCREQSEAAARYAEAAVGRRREHRQAKPGSLEIVFTLGRSIRRWNVEDEPLAAAQRAAESAASQAADHAVEAQRDLDEAEAAAGAARRARAGADGELAAAQARIDGIRQQSTARVPDDEWWDDADLRELEAPWLDSEWNAAPCSSQRSGCIARSSSPPGRRSCRSCVPPSMSRAARCPATPRQPACSRDGKHSSCSSPWSTTFASVDRMFGQLPSGSLGWLLIDEAGQATPQAAVGAIMRSKRVVAVGDPLQLEPVFPILNSTQAALRNHFGVDDGWAPSRLSVQSLADRRTPQGTHLPGGDSESIWVGSPLLAHRRCDSPMFDVVNDTVYRGLMINGVAGRPDPLSSADHPVAQSRWLDVRSPQASGHWRPEEGQKLRELLRELTSEGHVAPSSIMVISPFRSTAAGVGGVLVQLGLSRHITHGTIHVSQGKQADVVVLVLGGDPARPGALALGGFTTQPLQRRRVTGEASAVRDRRSRRLGQAAVLSHVGSGARPRRVTAVGRSS